MHLLKESFFTVLVTKYSHLTQVQGILSHVDLKTRSTFLFLVAVVVVSTIVDFVLPPVPDEMGSGISNGNGEFA